MKVKIVSDGTAIGTRLIDVDTGHVLDDVVRLTWDIKGGAHSLATVVLRRVPVEVSGEVVEGAASSPAANERTDSKRQEPERSVADSAARRSLFAPIVSESAFASLGKSLAKAGLSVCSQIVVHAGVGAEYDILGDEWFPVARVPIDMHPYNKSKYLYVRNS